MSKLHMCPSHDCNYGTVRRADWMRHIRRHHKNIFYCRHCIFAACNKDELRIHSEKHKEKIIKCKFCHLTYVRQELLKKHISRAHENDNSNRICFPDPNINNECQNEISKILKDSKNCKVIDNVLIQIIEINKEGQETLIENLSNLGNTETINFVLDNENNAWSWHASESRCWRLCRQCQQ